MRIYSIMLVKYENLFVMSIKKKYKYTKIIYFFIIIGIYDNGISNGRMYNSCFTNMSCNFNKL